MARLTPWDWQRVDQEVLARHNWTALLAIETGGAKTLAAVEAIRESGAETVLIVAPLGTHNTAWKPTVKSQLGVEARVISRSGRKAEREAMMEFEWGYPGIYLTTPQLVTRTDISAWAGDFLVVDELHLLTAPGSRGQRALSGFSSRDPEPLAHRFTHRLGLSGTPIRVDFARAWAIMRFLWPERSGFGDIADSNHWQWLHDRMDRETIVTGSVKGSDGKTVYQMDPVTGKMRPRLKTATKWTGESEPGRLFSEAPCVIQHFRRHRCCEFHPEGFLTNEEPQVLVREVELSPAQKRAIKEMEAHYITWLGDNPLVADLTITQKQRIRQMCLGVPSVEYGEDDSARVWFEDDCESPFYDELVGILQTLDEDEPTVVFLESQKFARVVTTRLNNDGYTAFEYSGQTTSTREGNLSEFGKPGGFQVAVVVISAGGTGLDGMQRVSNTEIWLERSVDPILNEQGEGRLDRMGARKGVQRYLIRDSLGYAEGQFNKQLTKLLRARASARKQVD